jgi:hypothetical protein
MLPSEDGSSPFHRNCYILPVYQVTWNHIPDDNNHNIHENFQSHIAGIKTKKQQIPRLSVCKGTIPIERPLLVGKVNAKFLRIERCRVVRVTDAHDRQSRLSRWHITGIINVKSYKSLLAFLTSFRLIQM